MSEHAPPSAQGEAPPKLEIDWLKTLAGALAAVSTAVLLSTLGAVGTLIGAALGSVAATVGSAVYAQGLARSKHAVLKAQETALLKVGIAQAEVRRASRRDGEQQAAHLDLADERLGEAKEELDEAALQPLTWADRLRVLPWRRITLAAAATFVVVVVAISSFEAISGRSVSSFTGGSSTDQGSTLGGVAGNSGSGRPDRPQQSESPSDFESATESPSESPTETSEPTETQTPTTTPTPTPTPTDSTTPTPTESTSPSPTTTATP
jgi:hypothetical protein